MNRVLAIASVLFLLILAALWHTPIKDFLWVHPWFHSFLVALPTVILAIVAFLELGHSDEANRLRGEEVILHRRIADLTAQLDAERNKHLGQIAKNMERPRTPAERNADILAKHLRATVTVEERGIWGNTPEIVEVSDDNIVTLFTARSHASPSAWAVRVRCEDLEITEIPQGNCPLRVKVLKRYGSDIKLGEIAKWEDRFQPAANPTFAKGGMAYHAEYRRNGSSETRTLRVYESNDGSNSFLLEASTGEMVVANNKEISKRFMLLQIDYEEAGFERTGSGDLMEFLYQGERVYITGSDCENVRGERGL